MLFALLAVAVMSGLVPGDQGAFPGDEVRLPGGDNVHDPDVFRAGGRYFCVCTSGNSFGTMRSSSDMTTWKIEGPILPETPEWLRQRYSHRSLWAPNVLVLGNRLRC